ncbi:hypothetical protein C4564_02425 [Candidatus Microgenomates bacterium]|nr:MAG: hypothetical protein C4564_02425 [Candidatus Microgenomates bacterium]
MGLHNLTQGGCDMRMGYSGPPYGIPIPREIHEQYSVELKAAWKTFDAWWKKDREGLPSRSQMPQDVADAMTLICETEIPTTGYTGDKSCYMVSVIAALTD